MKSALICGLPGESETAAVIVSLKDAGFLNTDISVLMPDNRDVDYVECKKPSSSPNAMYLCDSAGLIMAILRGVELAATSGDVMGGLIGLGMSQQQATEYEDKLRKGSVLLRVQILKKDEAQRAENIFMAAGARDIQCTSELVSF